MFWFIFADLLYYTHLAALLEGSSDIGNSNFHLREIFFLSLSLLAHRTGPRWHAAELVHSCWFFQTHVYSHSASHFSEIPTQRDIVTLQRCECVSVCVCVCVQEWLMQSFFMSLALCVMILVWYYVCYYLPHHLPFISFIYSYLWSEEWQEHIPTRSRVKGEEHFAQSQGWCVNTQNTHRQFQV